MEEIPHPQGIVKDFEILITELSAFIKAAPPFSDEAILAKMLGKAVANLQTSIEDRKF